jgi:hypothetical protein
MGESKADFGGPSAYVTAATTWDPPRTPATWFARGTLNPVPQAIEAPVGDCAASNEPSVCRVPAIHRVIRLRTTTV